MAWLRRLLGVRPEETRTLSIAIALAFVAIGAQGLSTLAVDSLFVSAFTLGELSRFYVVGSIVRVAAAFGYAALTRRILTTSGDSPLVSAGFDRHMITATSVLLVGCGAAALGASKTVIYLIALAQLLLPPLLPLIAFNAILSCFHARQAKRLLPLVAAGATLGTIAVGAVAGALATTLTSPGLLLLSGALCAVAIALPSKLAESAPADETAAPTASDHDSRPGLFAVFGDTLRDIRQVPVIRVVVLSAFFAAALANFTDFGLKAALKAEYDRDGIAAYLGTFTVLVNAAILLAQLGTTSRLVARFGVQVALMATPLLLLLLSPLTALLGFVAIATALRLVEMVGRYSFANACQDLLITPTDRAVRTRAKVVVKGMASPFGYLLSGALLASFGADGPSPIVLAVVIGITALLSLVALSNARRAYTEALASAISRGRFALATSVESAQMLRAELGRLLERACDERDEASAKRLLGLMHDRFFALRDLAPALATGHAAIHERGVETALRLASTGDGERLLELADPDEDRDLEARLLQRARELGAVPTSERIERARSIGLAEATHSAGAALWAESHLCTIAAARATLPAAEAQPRVDAAVKALRKAALGEDGPQRAASLDALGELRERRAEREIVRGMGSRDRMVFEAAARAAVRIDATGAIATLVHRLTSGPFIRGSSRALALAGPLAINDLIAALPTTRGEGAIAPTAVASGTGFSGTVRAARVLSRLGPQACDRVLDRFADLGYRARNAVARSLAAAPEDVKTKMSRERVEPAMQLIVAYAERLADAWPHVPKGRAGHTGLLAREISQRLSETAMRILDLAALTERADYIARARAALTGGVRDRAAAIELLDNILPEAIRESTVRILEHEAAALDGGAARPSADQPTSDHDPTQAFDGWLRKCRELDVGELSSSDSMTEVLERVLALSESTLFGAVSGEELYPLAEIAQPSSYADGEIIIAQGDPGDALFVIAEGSVRVEKDDQELRALGAGDVFGEMALLDGAPRAATIRAKGACEVLRIPRAEFEALLDESPEIARGLIRTLLSHLRG